MALLAGVGVLPLVALGLLIPLAATGAGPANDGCAVVHTALHTERLAELHITHSSLPVQPNACTIGPQ